MIPYWQIPNPFLCFSDQEELHEYYKYYDQIIDQTKIDQQELVHFDKRALGAFASDNTLELTVKELAAIPSSPHLQP